MPLQEKSYDFSSFHSNRYQLHVSTLTLLLDLVSSYRISASFEDAIYLFSELNINKVYCPSSIPDLILNSCFRSRSYFDNEILSSSSLCTKWNIPMSFFCYSLTSFSFQPIYSKNVDLKTTRFFKSYLRSPVFLAFGTIYWLWSFILPASWPSILLFWGHIDTFYLV